MLGYISGVQPRSSHALETLRAAHLAAPYAAEWPVQSLLPASDATPRARSVCVNGSHGQATNARNRRSSRSSPPRRGCRERGRQGRTSDVMCASKHLTQRKLVDFALNWDFLVPREPEMTCANAVQTVNFAAPSTRRREVAAVVVSIGWLTV